MLRLYNFMSSWQGLLINCKIVDVLSFTLVWNVPSQPCSQKFGIDLNIGKYGIQFNKDQNFMGEVVSLFYNLGTFPRFAPSSPNPVPVNGGIPQLGNLSLHLRKVHDDITKLTQKNFSGKHKIFGYFQ